MSWYGSIRIYDDPGTVELINRIWATERQNVNEEKSRKAKREAKNRIVAEKRAALRAWRAGVRKILTECRRREAARSFCDTYDQACEHLNNHLNGVSL